MMSSPPLICNVLTFLSFLLSQRNLRPPGGAACTVAYDADRNDRSLGEEGRGKNRRGRSDSRGKTPPGRPPVSGGLRSLPKIRLWLNGCRWRRTRPRWASRCWRNVTWQRSWFLKAPETSVSAPSSASPSTGDCAQ